MPDGDVVPEEVVVPEPVCVYVDVPDPVPDGVPVTDAVCEAVTDGVVDGKFVPTGQWKRSRFWNAPPIPWMTFFRS